jgi:apolipoprotein N-acyltransferase
MLPHSSTVPPTAPPPNLTGPNEADNDAERAGRLALAVTVVSFTLMMAVTVLFTGMLWGRIPTSAVEPEVVRRLAATGHISQLACAAAAYVGGVGKGAGTRNGRAAVVLAVLMLALPPMLALLRPLFQG